MASGTDLKVLVLPLVLVGGFLFPLFVFGHRIEVDLLASFRYLDNVTLRKVDGATSKMELTLTIGVINSTRNLGTLSSDG